MAEALTRAQLDGLRRDWKAFEDALTASIAAQTNSTTQEPTLTEAEASAKALLDATLATLRGHYLSLFGGNGVTVLGWFLSARQTYDAAELGRVKIAEPLPPALLAQEMYRDGPAVISQWQCALHGLTDGYKVNLDYDDPDD